MANATLTHVIRRATGSLGATGEHCSRHMILAAINQSKAKLFGTPAQRSAVPDFEFAIVNNTADFGRLGSHRRPWPPRPCHSTVSDRT